MPAPAPRIQSGGEASRKSADSARMSGKAGNDEGDAADQRARRSAHAARTEDRELRRCRPGQQVARGDRVLELLGVEPAAVVDDQPAEQ